MIVNLGSENPRWTGEHDVFKFVWKLFIKSQIPTPTGIGHSCYYHLQDKMFRSSTLKRTSTEKNIKSVNLCWCKMFRSEKLDTENPAPHY